MSNDKSEEKCRAVCFCANSRKETTLEIEGNIMLILEIQANKA
jgi:hypothetical protein